MAIRVEIEGKGQVAEFPDGTSQRIIDLAIKRDYFSKKESKEPLMAESEMMSDPNVLPALGAVASGAVSWIPAGITKAAGIVSGQREGGEQLANAIQEKMTPTLSPVSESIVKGVSAPFEYISEKSKEAADWTYEKTGSPLLATSVRVAGESIPFVAPVGVGKGIKSIKGQLRSLDNMRGVIPEIAEKPIKTEASKVRESPVEESAKLTETPAVEILETETKPAKAAVDINKEIVERGFNALPEEELASYPPKVIAEQKERISGLVQNKESFMEMAKGNETIPEGVSPQLLFNTAKELAKNDIDTLYELSKSPIASELSVHAQEMRMSQEGRPHNDVVTKLTEVRKARESQVPDPKVKETVRTELKKEVEKVNLTPEEMSWDRFLRRIEC